ncbi:MAG: hypothetical protein LUD17_05515 [Bacteroidales bacterium]|nr:hypothetical protein [Bacteroidales bacterium]
MSKCLLFNPENDVALAMGVDNYTAPAPARKLRQAGALMPLWYGRPGDRVLCYGVNARWLEQMQHDFGLGTDIFDHQDFSLTPQPWGWSLASRRNFLTEGFPADALPTDQWLAEHRRLSARYSSDPIRQVLTESGITGLVSNYGTTCYSIEEAKAAVDAIGAAWIVKLPWSSSGRGVVNSAIAGEKSAWKVVEDGIRAQGCVSIEPAYDKAIDFAKIFELKDGKCQCLGTSVFLTDDKGAYSGNLLASEQKRIERVGVHCDLGALDRAASLLTQEIEKIYGSHYSGILGVDMLATKDGLIDPLVEVNLRMTMGWVAIRLSESLLPEGAEGTLMVQKNGGHFTPSEYQASDNRLASGILNLVPPNPDFDFLVSV